MNVVALAGGVGGAKLADGLAQALPPESLTIIVNTGDDFEHMGLSICPDLDTVCYTLAGIANPATGWGRTGESWQALESLSELGGPAWFRLGDKDLGVHLERTRRLRRGQPLSQITRHFCQAWGIRHPVLPATDDNVPTWVYTDEGELPFQEYFVHRHCHPRVTGFRFEGVEQAQPAPGVLELASKDTPGGDLPLQPMGEHWPDPGSAGNSHRIGRWASAGGRHIPHYRGPGDQRAGRENVC